MLRKICSLLLLALLCVGCTNSGSFEEGTMNLTKLYDDVVSEIEDEHLNMGILPETSLGASSLEVSYGIKSVDIQDFVVYQSIIPADCGEIAMFHVKEDKKKIVEDGINQRIAQMKNEHALLPDQIAIIEGYQMTQLGEYIIFVSGVDAQKVIQYISSR